MELLRVFVNLCKRWLYLNTNVLGPLYFCVLIALSAIFKWIKIPPSYFSNSGNIFNVYFLKRKTPWFTLALTLPFVFCLHFIYGFGKARNTFVPIVRIVVNCLILFIMSCQFDVIGSLVGTCSKSAYNNQEFICTLWGFKWTALDISGHIFQNLFAILTIMEETKYFKLWELVEYIVDAILHGNKQRKVVCELIKNEINPMDQAALINSYQKVSTFLQINFCALGLLAIMLHIANLLTVMYFHTVVENSIAGIIALIIWVLCYRVVYPSYGENEKSLEMHWNLVAIAEEDENSESEKLNMSVKSMSYQSV